MFSILKAQRYFRISKVISESNSPIHVKVSLTILYDVVLIFLYVHITGCMFFKVITSNQKMNWIPPYDYIDGSKSEFYFKANGDKQDWTYQYGCCLYYMMIIVGGNEIGPGDMNELIYVCLFSIFGLIIKVYMFGELSLLMPLLSTAAAAQQKIIDTANVAMANVGLTQEIRRDVRTHLNFVQETAEKQTELNNFLADISDSLKKKIVVAIFTEEMKENGTINEMQKNMKNAVKTYNSRN